MYNQMHNYSSVDERELGKSFEDANKEDIRSLLQWMDDKNYKASTHEKFRRVLKFK
jgi:hypothetical protein